MLKYLTEADVQAIVTAAEKRNSAHPPSELGSSLEELRERRYRPDPEGDALKDTITRLSHDARRELMALMWLGRGDVAGSFAGHLKQAYKHPDEGIDYIAAKSPALPKYFRAGLEKVRREGRP
jgi:hypothetical protein